MKRNLKFVVACGLATLCTANPLLAQESQTSNNQTDNFSSIKSALVPWSHWLSSGSIETTRNQTQAQQAIRDNVNPFGVPMLNEEFAGQNLLPVPGRTMRFNDHGYSLELLERQDAQTRQGSVAQQDIQTQEHTLTQQGRLVEGRLVEDRTVEGRLVEGRLVEGRSVEGRSVEGRLVEQGTQMELGQQLVAPAQVQNQQQTQPLTGETVVTWKNVTKGELTELPTRHRVQTETVDATVIPTTRETVQSLATPSVTRTPAQVEQTLPTQELARQQFPTQELPTQEFATQQTTQSTLRSLEGTPFGQVTPERTAESLELTPLATTPAPIVSPENYSLEMRKESTPVALGQARTLKLGQTEEVAAAATVTTSAVAATKPAKKTINKKAAGAILANAYNAASWWSFVPYILFTLLGALCLSFFSLKRKGRSAQGQSLEARKVETNQRRVATERSQRSNAASLTTRSERSTQEESGDLQVERDLEFSQYDEFENESADVELRGSRTANTKRDRVEFTADSQDVVLESQTDDAVRFEQRELSGQDSDRQEVSSERTQRSEVEAREPNANRKGKGKKRGSKQRNKSRSTRLENETTEFTTDSRDAVSESQTEEAVRFEQRELSGDDDQQRETREPNANRNNGKGKRRKSKRGSQQQFQSETSSACEFESNSRDAVQDSSSRVETQCSAENADEDFRSLKSTDSGQARSINSSDRDDLTQLEGIDSKTQQALYNAGYYRFSDFANADEKQLKNALAKSNLNVSTSDTWGWIRLASIAQEQQGSNREYGSSRGNNSKRSKNNRTVKRQSWTTEEINNAAANDDLTRISGVDAASAKLLKNSGIRTFRQLYKAGPERIAQIFENAGNKFKMIDTSQWAPQAKYAMNNDWNGLTQWLEANGNSQSEATNNTRTSQRRTTTGGQDDLTRIKGIGPAAQKHMRKQGVNTFEDIANMAVEELKSLFSSDSRFQMLKQDTWPDQARTFFNEQQDASCVAEENILDEIQSLTEMGSSVNESTTTQDKQKKQNQVN